MRACASIASPEVLVPRRRGGTLHRILVGQGDELEMEGDENVFDSSPRRNLIPARAGTTTTMTTPPTKPKPTRASPGSGAAVGAKKMSNVPAVKSVHVGPLWTHWEEQLACSRADVDEMRTARDAATRAKDELAEKLRVALDALTTTRSENTELSERVAALELARADDARAMEALREEHATQTASTAERHATELSEGMDAKCKRIKWELEHTQKTKKRECAELSAQLRAMRKERAEREASMREELAAVEAQRGRFGAHAEVLVKDKERHMDELTRLRVKLRLMVTAMEEMDRVGGGGASAAATATSAVRLRTRATIEEDSCAPSPATTSEPFTPAPARMPRSLLTNVHGMHDSPASIERLDRRAGVVYTPPVASGAKAVAKAAEAEAEAFDAFDFSDGTPSKEDIARRKSALAEKTRASLVRSARKPLLSPADRAAVTSSNPWSATA
jgi:hypothetical protein